MSRAYDNLVRKLEAEQQRELALGARAISENAASRKLIAVLLETTGAAENYGMGLNPFATNALTTAHEAGKMAAVQTLITLISEHVPHFYPDLIKEIQDARAEHTARLAEAARDSAE